MEYAHDLLKTMINSMNSKNITPTVNHMSMVNAGLRPSGKSYRDRLVNGEINKNPSKEIDELLKDNNCFLIFQEDTIKFLTNICGFSGSKADTTRRAIGKKDIVLLNEQLPDILEGYCNHSNQPREVAEEEAKAFIQIISDSSDYQFGFNHSTGYSMVGYMACYLRAYYPIEFITAYLNNAENDDDYTNGNKMIIEYGITLKNPQFRYSKGEYFFDRETNSIYKGIGSIKFFNNNVGEQLYALRDNQYARFEDLLVDIYEKTDCNSKHIGILIKIGFFEEFDNINKLLRTYEIFDKLYNKKQITIKKAQEDYAIEEEQLAQFGNNISEKTGKAGTTYKELDWLSMVKFLVDKENFIEPTLSERIGYQIECLGFSNITDTSLPKSICYVSDIQINSWGGIFVTLYCIKSGKSATLRADKRFYDRQEEPLEKGDVINIEVKKKERKKKNPNPTGKHDMWLPTGEYYTELSSWSYVILD